ncbi:acyl-CoA dehydrogenase [Photorhabdus luminescens subsp. luminescens]|uniref:Acyl-CoA dehydrogenase n=1 Tax=Photorhabdus luminescens TaxID=29488 RepID=A0A1G5PQM0_PHOLU|nr:acyl-CoA dehydrogenase family protein [Photorhabdus luminescens]KMW74709.1 acyl-CoA dehydrogenase [Photorhabdus luminescens subsp. luminescens]MCW7762858.1 acyl-CoA dehydrogenase family protein [Photorhabdus luminescens subsp. venezuelensis]SCZ51945.1 Acyl-CoA dehydrogenase [Photorhabdus luminescens]
MPNRIDEQRILLHDNAARFARDQLKTDIATADRTGTFYWEGWRKCAEFGLFKMAIPENCGGEGASLSDLLSVMEGLGYGCEDQGLLFSLNAHLWTVTMQLAIHGTPAQRSRFLPGLIDGTLIGANGSTEDEAGSDVFSMRTHAVRDGDSYVLNGSKIYITNAPIANLYVIYATINPTLGPLGITAFLIESTTPGIEVSQPLEKMGLRTALMGQITLKECRIPADAILGREGRGIKIFESAMEYERGCILATTLGSMRRSLEACITYARTRRQFGQPIGKNQAVSHRIADMKVNLDAACELVYQVGRLKDAGKNAIMEAACAKLFVSETYTKLSLDVLRIYGAKGYLAESPTERELRNSIASVIYSGTSDIQRNIIASELGL